MKKYIDTIEIGAGGTLGVATEDEFIYPYVIMEGFQGETVEMSFQHTTVKKLREISEFFASVAETIEKQNDSN